jgi:hypothetical protein
VSGFDKRILGLKRGPPLRDIGQLPIRGIVKHPYFAPALSAIDELKLLVQLRVKGVSNPEELRRIDQMGCSWTTTPKENANA